VLHAAVIVGHLFLGGVIILVMWAAEWMLHVLWQEQEPKFFGWIPVKWFFDASDLGIMTLFVFWGIRGANEQLRR